MENLLDEINELIEEENGNPIGLHDTIVSSGVDSFGLTMVVLEILDKYGIAPSKQSGRVSYARLTPFTVYRRILLAKINRQGAKNYESK